MGSPMMARPAMDPRSALHEIMARRETMDLERETTLGRVSTLSTHDITLGCVPTPALHDSTAARVSMDLTCESTAPRGFTGVPYVGMV